MKFLAFLYFFLGGISFFYPSFIFSALNFIPAQLGFLKSIEANQAPLSPLFRLCSISYLLTLSVLALVAGQKSNQSSVVGLLLASHLFSGLACTYLFFYDERSFAVGFLGVINALIFIYLLLSMVQLKIQSARKNATST